MSGPREEHDARPQETWTTDAQGTWRPVPPPPGTWSPQGHPATWPPEAWLPPGPPPRRPRTGLLVGAVVGAAVLLLGVAVVVAAAGGRSSDGTAVAVVGAPAATRTTEPEAARAGAAPAATVAPSATGEVDVDVVVGGCIRLGGTEDAAVADPAACGSQEANYVVVAVVPTSAECLRDVDATYYEMDLRDRETGALCLDVDWVEGDCFDLGGEDPVRAACDPDDLDVWEVGPTIEGTSSFSACEEDGIPYTERDLIVCLLTPTG